MLVVVMFCAGILSAQPGCREVHTALFDVAATQIACNTKAQEVIAETGKLLPDMRPVRWGCRRRKGNED